ncbi:hypothetical protein B5X24_HaOG214688 [Helicoverpa armigera]|uniref:PHD-type domain-containing protein n=1 Tax=Helicoverpa armigera TaxID=29058 RepID=A0A2W1B279_HELAM|nr:hypothetical protein B5X24_HaOG214688 [Helicoverpa armigera]
MANCDTCELPVKHIEKIICSNCDKVYHHLCVNLSASAFKRLSKLKRSAWNCPSCLSKQPSDKSQSDNMVDSSDDEENKMNDIRRIIRDEIRNTMRREVKSMIGELRSEMNDIRKQLDELKQSSSFDISQVNDLKAEFRNVQTENTELRSRNCEMEKTVAQLTARLNSLDQSMRDANLEIHGLPENKNEVLPNVIIKLANVVSYALKDGDIMNRDKL